jgi:hypothetical protein
MGYFAQGPLNSGGHFWYTGDAAVGSTTKQMTLDTAGNLGLGVTPSTWAAGFAAFNFSSGGVIWSNGNNAIIGSNHYYNGANYIYKNSDFATRFQQSSGSFQWYNAPSGTAGAAITFTQAMTLDASGNLLVGTTATNAALTQGVTAVINSGASKIHIGHVTGTVDGSTYAVFSYNGTAIGTITQTGTAGVLYNTSSDYRLKNITGPITTSGAYIDSLKPVEGTWKADGSTFVGLIAHETQEASRTTVATGTKDGAEMQGMDYSSAEIIANLIAELQSLRARVAQLESK